jgi:hypothetical protein
MAISETLTGNGKSGTLKGYGGPVTISASGTFGSGTITVEYSRDDGVTWPFTESEIAWTDNDIAIVTLTDGLLMRFDLSGATTTPSVLVEAY